MQFAVLRSLSKGSPYFSLCEGGGDARFSVPFRSVRAGAAIILRGVECRGRDGSAVAIVGLPGVEVLNCGLWERWRTIGGSLLILRTIGSCVEISAGAAAVLCNVCSTAGDWLLWSLCISGIRVAVVRCLQLVI